MNTLSLRNPRPWHRNEFQSLITHSRFMKLEWQWNARIEEVWRDV